MTKNFSDFADPISLNQPTGTDIEYDARFIDVQTLVEGKPEQQYGEVIIEAQEPDWSTVEKLCRQILSESKDIRVFCFYTQALTANYGMAGFRKGCEIIATNISNYWQELYPKLVDEDGDYDAFYRSGSISLLLAESGIIRQLHEANVIYSPSRKSHFTVKSVTSILNNNEDGSYPGGREKLIEDLKVAYENEQEELVALKESLRLICKIEDIFNENIQDFPLDFSILKRPLEKISYLLTEHIQFDVKEDALVYENEIMSTSKRSPEQFSAIGNLEDIKIKDRSDVKIVLEKLNLYFRLKEPSHPAPLFIERLQKLMDMSFYDILRNISPSSLNDLDLIIGKENSEESDEE